MLSLITSSSRQAEGIPYSVLTDKYPNPVLEYEDFQLELQSKLSGSINAYMNNVWVFIIKILQLCWRLLDKWTSNTNWHPNIYFGITPLIAGYNYPLHLRVQWRSVITSFYILHSIHKMKSQFETRVIIQTRPAWPHHVINGKISVSGWKPTPGQQWTVWWW